MINSIDLFNRAVDNYDFAGYWQVEDACLNDLKTAWSEYQKAFDEYQKAFDNRKGAYDLDADLACLEMYRKYTDYLAREILYNKFERHYKK